MQKRFDAQYYGQKVNRRSFAERLVKNFRSRSDFSQEEKIQIFDDMHQRATALFVDQVLVIDVETVQSIPSETLMTLFLGEHVPGYLEELREMFPTLSEQEK